MAIKRIKIRQINLGESYVSLFLGLIVVIIVAFLILSLGKNRHIKATSSIQDGPVIQEEEVKDQSQNKERAYIVKSGENLWTISENVYKDGYKWVEIAKANKLDNPGLIFKGDRLTIPEIKTAITATPPPMKQQNEIKTNSITENSYAIVKGDNLWDIAVRAYGDGYKWIDIAKANNLENPGLIFSDNILKIPRSP